MNKTRKITCVAIAGTIILSGLGIGVGGVLKRTSPHDGEMITSISVEYEDVSESDINSDELVTDVYEETTFDEVKCNYDSYDEYLSKLKEVLSEKNFGSDIDELIIQCFNRVHNNCDYYLDTYKCNGMYNKEEFLNDIFINNIRDNVDEFNLVNFNDYPDIKPYAGRYYAEDKVIDIGGYGNYKEYEDTYYSIIHELVGHATQRGFDVENVGLNLYNICTEGAAVDSTMSIKDCFEVQTVSPIFITDDTCYSIKGMSSASNAYSLYSKCYAMLLSIVDFNVLQQVYKDNSLECVVNYINNNYSIDGASFLNEMDSLCSNFLNGNDEATCKNVEILEQSINKCFSEKIEKLDSAEEVVDFINIKRCYDMNFATEYLTDYEDQYSFSIEKKSKLDPYNVNDMLYNKTREFDIFSFSDDESKNRLIFGAIMGESSDRFSYYSTYEEKTIDKLSFSLSGDEDYFTLYGKDGNPIVQYCFSDNIALRGEEEILTNKLNESKPLISNYSKVI